MPIHIYTWRNYPGSWYLLPCVSKIVAFIVKNIETIIFAMFSWLAIGWLDPSHTLKIKAQTLKYSLSHVTRNSLHVKMMRRKGARICTQAHIHSTF